MSRVYLFDWGDTLMIDFPDENGKMCDWPVVEALPGAQEALSHLSKSSDIFIATGAANSTEQDIERAFERVGLNEYITGYFCKQNLGLTKGSSEFYLEILKHIGMPSQDVTMVGDNLEKDILPALEVGLRAVLLSDIRPAGLVQRVKVIGKLTELCA